MMGEGQATGSIVSAVGKQREMDTVLHSFSP